MEKNNLPVYRLDIVENDESEVEVDFVALVDRPAIEKTFQMFKADEFLAPGPTENHDEWISRCMGVIVGEEGKDEAQAYAICESKWDREGFKGLKISFDYDETLSTDRGKELAINRINDGDVIYIISARQDKDAMLSVANELGIPESRVYATGSNKAKVEKIKELGINKHYDNNADVIAELGEVGIKFADMFAESYSDYPDAVKNNAKAAIKWTEENGWGDCGTDVGKQRAHDLANGRPVSLETVKRMYSFLSRHKQNAEKSSGYGDGCGQLMYDAWGGASALSWAESKIRQAEKSQFAIQDEEERIISGPLMLANKPIFRFDSFGEYYVYFTPDTIKKIVQKVFRKGYQSNVNIMHDGNQVVDGVTMFESWIVDREQGKMPMKGYEDAADGSWFGSYKVNNDEVWQDIKDGKYKGFSVEGIFNYIKADQVNTDEEKMRKIIDILESIDK